MYLGRGSGYNDGRCFFLNVQDDGFPNYLSQSMDAALLGPHCRNFLARCVFALFTAGLVREFAALVNLALKAIVAGANRFFFPFLGDVSLAELPKDR
jgi:hypothetical protein